MFKIKRTKKNTGMGQLMPPAVHWVKKLTPRGSIDLFTPKENQAGQFDQAICELVAKYYEGKENAGEFEFVQVAPPPEVPDLTTVKVGQQPAEVIKKPEVKSELSPDYGVKMPEKQKAGK